MDNKLSVSAQCMSGTTSGAQCTRKTSSPDGMCPQHRNAALPVKTARSNQYLKMPPPKVVMPEATDSAALHGVDMLKELKDPIVNSVKAGNYYGAVAVALVAGVTSALAYTEASQKRGWKFTKEYRQLRWLNTIIPSPFEESVHPKLEVHAGGFTVKIPFVEKAKANWRAAVNDTSYLTPPTENYEVLRTLAIHRAGLEEDSSRAEAQGQYEAEGIYKGCSQLIVALAYEEDPAAAAEGLAKHYDELPLSTTGQWSVGFLEKMPFLSNAPIPFNIPKLYQKAATQEAIDAQARLATRYREIASTLRNPPSKKQVPTTGGDYTASAGVKTKSGTIFNIN